VHHGRPQPFTCCLRKARLLWNDERGCAGGKHCVSARVARRYRGGAQVRSAHGRARLVPEACELRPVGVREGCGPACRGAGCYRRRRNQSAGHGNHAEPGVARLPGGLRHCKQPFGATLLHVAPRILTRRYSARPHAARTARGASLSGTHSYTPKRPACARAASCQTRRAHLSVPGNTR